MRSKWCRVHEEQMDDFELAQESSFVVLVYGLCPAVFVWARAEAWYRSSVLVSVVSMTYSEEPCEGCLETKREHAKCS